MMSHDLLSCITNHNYLSKDLKAVKAVKAVEAKSSEIPTTLVVGFGGAFW
jgi:hypothetical protein